MVIRGFWLNKIEEALSRRSVLWLSGVRRAGKTVLCQTLPGIEYFDCELPRVRRMVEDPQTFLSGLKGRRVVLDEIHRLNNPAEVLKIAADRYPETRIVATGSSSLGASAKFRDSLAGRKSELWLTPMTSADLDDFGQPDLSHRFVHGGLPPFFLAKGFPERDLQEWMEAYWAKDILELFRLERRHSFLKFAELLMVQSGGLFEASSFAVPCEVSRTTISNYLAVLEATYVAHVIRPFSSRRSSEIVSAPKVYAFDTGFVCYCRGWERLRRDDLRSLWEHYVLNEMFAHTQSRKVLYWRDKQGHEIDFVLTKRQEAPVAVECRWTASDFDPATLRIFRRRYADGANYIVSSDVDRPFSRSYGEMSVTFVGLGDLIRAISS